MEKQYVILYTHQKQKKAKTWHDGVLKHSGQGTRAVLYDEKGGRLDTLHLRVEDVTLGEQLESDRYLILVEELKPAQGQSGQQQGTMPSGQAVSVPSNENKDRVQSYSQASQSQLSKAKCAGLKRKKTGFMPPRMVKQPSHDSQEEYDQSRLQPTDQYLQTSCQGYFQQTLQHSRARAVEERFYGNTSMSQSDSLFDSNNPVVSGKGYSNLLGMYGTGGRSGSDSSSQDSTTEVPSLSPWSVYGSSKSSPSLTMPILRKGSDGSGYNRDTEKGTESYTDRQVIVPSLGQTMNETEHSEHGSENPTSKYPVHSVESHNSSPFYEGENRHGIKTGVGRVTELSEVVQTDRQYETDTANQEVPKRKLAHIMNLIRKRPLMKNDDNIQICSEKNVRNSKPGIQNYSNGTTVPKVSSYQNKERSGKVVSAQIQCSEKYVENPNPGLQTVPNDTRVSQIRSCLNQKISGKVVPAHIQCQEIADSDCKFMPELERAVCKEERVERKQAVHVTNTFPSGVDLSLQSPKERLELKSNSQRSSENFSSDHLILNVDDGENKLEDEDDSMMNYDIEDSQFIQQADDAKPGHVFETSMNMYNYEDFADDKGPCMKINEDVVVANSLVNKADDNDNLSITENVSKVNVVTKLTEELPVESDLNIAGSADTKMSESVNENSVVDFEDDAEDMFAGSFSISFSPLSHVDENSTECETGSEMESHLQVGKDQEHPEKVDFWDVTDKVNVIKNCDEIMSGSKGNVELSTGNRYTSDTIERLPSTLPTLSGSNDISEAGITVSELQKDSSGKNEATARDRLGVNEICIAQQSYAGDGSEKDLTTVNEHQDGKFQQNDPQPDVSFCLTNLDMENSEVKIETGNSGSYNSDYKTFESQDTMDLSLGTNNDDSECFFTIEQKFNPKPASSTFDFRQTDLREYNMSSNHRPVDSDSDLNKVGVLKHTEQVDATMGNDAEFYQDMSEGSDWFENMKETEFEERVHRQPSQKGFKETSSADFNLPADRRRTEEVTHEDEVMHDGLSDDSLMSPVGSVQLPLTVSPLSNLPHPSQLFKKTRKQVQTAPDQHLADQTADVHVRERTSCGSLQGKQSTTGMTGYWLNRTSSCVVSRQLSMAPSDNKQSSAVSQDDMSDDSPQMLHLNWNERKPLQIRRDQSWTQNTSMEANDKGEGGVDVPYLANTPLFDTKVVSSPELSDSPFVLSRPCIQAQSEDDEIYTQLYRPRPMYCTQQPDFNITSNNPNSRKSEVNSHHPSSTQTNEVPLKEPSCSGFQMYKQNPIPKEGVEDYFGQENLVVQVPEEKSKVEHVTREVCEQSNNEFVESIDLFEHSDNGLQMDEISGQVADVSDNNDGVCIPREKDLSLLTSIHDGYVGSLGLQNRFQSTEDPRRNISESQTSEEFFVPVKNNQEHQHPSDDRDCEGKLNKCPSKWGRYIPSDTSDDGFDLVDYVVETSTSKNKEFSVIEKPAVKVLTQAASNRSDAFNSNIKKNYRDRSRNQEFIQEMSREPELILTENEITNSTKSQDQQSEIVFEHSNTESEMQEMIKMPIQEKRYKHDQAVPGSFPSTDSFDELFENDPFECEDLASSKKSISSSQDNLGALFKDEADAIDGDSEALNKLEASDSDENCNGDGYVNIESKKAEEVLDKCESVEKETKKVDDNVPYPLDEELKNEDCVFSGQLATREISENVYKESKVEMNKRLIKKRSDALNPDTVHGNDENGIAESQTSNKHVRSVPDETKHDSDNSDIHISKKIVTTKEDCNDLIMAESCGSNGNKESNPIWTLDDSLNISFADIEPPNENTVNVNSEASKHSLRIGWKPPLRPTVSETGDNVVNTLQAEGREESTKLKPTFNKCLKLLSKMKAEAGEANKDVLVASRTNQDVLITPTTNQVSNNSAESVSSNQGFKGKHGSSKFGSQASKREHHSQELAWMDARSRSFDDKDSPKAVQSNRGANIGQQPGKQGKGVNKGFQPPAMKHPAALRSQTRPVPNKQLPLVPSTSAIAGQQSDKTKASVCCDKLYFPRQSDVEVSPSVLRQVVIPVTFPSAAVYKQVLTQAVVEYVNSLLFDVSRRYHQALTKVDVSGVCHSGSVESGKASTNPACQCGVPSKMIMVRKEGRNNGRFFYACAASRKDQCKFFQWADEQTKGGTPMSGGGSRRRIDDCRTLSLYMKDQRLHFYGQCALIKRSKEHLKKYFKAPKWVRRTDDEETMQKKQLFLRLPFKGQSSLYAKDDVWVVSSQLTFAPGQTFLARSTFYGPNASNEVEIEPLESYSPSNWGPEAICHAILVGNISSELSYLDNIQDHVNVQTLPLLPQLLQRSDSVCASQDARFQAPRFQGQGQSANVELFVNSEQMDELSQQYIEDYSLNQDQAEALRRVAAMFTAGKSVMVDDVLLIHGVFGAGKSYLLSVMVLFLMEIFQFNLSQAGDSSIKWKLLISSTTNVAVDRILMGLLDLGFTEFIRVGSVKKIAKPVLPYSVHATGTDSQELKDLQTMLRSDELTPAEKSHVRQSIEKHRLGENKKKLKAVQVVGVTCASCSLPCLNNMTFPLVLLDECSQMTEPSSLLPVARFGCRKLLLVGDPKQLDPTVQGAEAAHTQGLEQTLFNRLIKMGCIPTILRTQYRCHPNISAVANKLFYGGMLMDGVVSEDRKPLLDVLPTLCYYDVDRGQEGCKGVGSYYNEREAQFVVFLLSVLLASGLEPQTIGVITLYRSQMSLIADLITGQDCGKEMKGIQVSTVDAFQGGERDVIILSCVRTDACGFIDNDKRTNVALTRARHHLLIVGNLRNLSQNHLWGNVISLCRGLPNGIQSADEARLDLEQYLETLRNQETSKHSTPTEMGTSQGRRGKKRQLSGDTGSVVSLSDGGSVADVKQRKRGKKRQLSGNTESVASLSDDDFMSPVTGKENRPSQSKAAKRPQRLSKKATDEMNKELSETHSGGAAGDDVTEMEVLEEFSGNKSSPPMSLSDVSDNDLEEVEPVVDEPVHRRPNRVKLSHRMSVAQLVSDDECSENDDNFPEFSI